MSITADRLAQHGIWAQLDALERVSSAALHGDGLTEDASAVMLKSMKLAERFRSTLRAADPDLVSMPMLQELVDSHLPNLNSWAQQTLDGTDQTASMIAELDYLIAVLSRVSEALPSIATSEPVAVVAQYREEVDRGEAHLRNRLSELEADLANTRAVLVEAQATSAALATQLQTTRAENEQVIATLRAEIAAESAAAIDEAKSTFRAQIATIDADSAERLGSLNAQLDAQQRAGDALLERLADLEEQAKATVESVSDNVLSGDYGSYAAKERRAANWMTGWAVLAGLVAASFAVWGAIHSATTEITWQRAITKITATVVLAGIAGYLGAQAHEHRVQERRARRRHLDLKALGPFIVQLPEPEQQAIRKDIAGRAFLQDEVAAAPPRSPRRGLTVSDVTTLLEALREARK